MIENELRIGNYVYYGVKIVKVKSIHTESVIKDEVSVYIELNENLRHYCVSIDDIKPIKLTEEILLKCGFEKREDGDYNLFKYSEVDIVICSDFSSWKCDGINFSVNYIKHLHQLQNLYFALTGTELNIEL